MSDIAQAKAALMAASNKLTEAGGALQQGHGQTEEAQMFVMNAAEGTSLDDYNEVMGLVADALEKATDGQRATLTAADRAASMAARL